MVFRDVVRVKAGTLECFDDFQTLLVEIMKRQFAAIQVIEDTKFQGHLPDHHRWDVLRARLPQLKCRGTRAETPLAKAIRRRLE